jgi:uncharacterized RDD family membrane protein YckC
VPDLASWWQRLAAFVLDLALAGLVASVLASAAAGPDVKSTPGGGYEVVWSRGTVTAVALLVILVTAYFTFLNGSRRGQTLGKALLGIAVRDGASYGQLGAGRALVRSLTMVAFYPLFVPWVLDGLWPLWDRRSQTLHDKVAGSVVVRVR